MGVFGEMHIEKIQLVPVDGPVFAIRVTGTVRCHWDEPAPDDAMARVRREANLHAGDAVVPDRHIELERGSRLTVRLSTGEVRDWISPWDGTLTLSFVNGEVLRARHERLKET